MVPISNEKLQALDGLIEQGLADGLFLGAAYRVLRKPDQVLASGRMGFAQEEPLTRVLSNTVWDLASLTKPIVTATSILILAEAGEFHLDEEIRRFLPEEAPSLEGITLRHCLTHTSGLKPWEKLHSQDLEREEILRRVRASVPENAPGTAYAYSDLGYILLGEVVEHVTQRTLPQFAEDWVFDPLGMRSTRYLPPEEWTRRLAATRCPDRERVLTGEVHDGNCAAMGGAAGHAGLFGTIDDLTLYARMLLNEGDLDGSRVLSPLAARQMMRNQNPPGLNGHTLGWFTRPNGFLPAADFWPEDTFGHTGFTGTSLLLSPSSGIAAILLTNRVYMENDGSDFLRFRRRFHNAIAALVP